MNFSMTRLTTTTINKKFPLLAHAHRLSRSSGLQKNIYFIPGHACSAAIVHKAQHPNSPLSTHLYFVHMRIDQNYYLHCIACVCVCYHRAHNTARYTSIRLKLVHFYLTHQLYTFCLCRCAMSALCIFDIESDAIAAAAHKYKSSLFALSHISFYYTHVYMCVCCNEFDIDMFLLLYIISIRKSHVCAAIFRALYKLFELHVLE